MVHKWVMAKTVNQIKNQTLISLLRNVNGLSDSSWLILSLIFVRKWSLKGAARLPALSLKYRHWLDHSHNYYTITLRLLEVNYYLGFLFSYGCAKTWKYPNPTRNFWVFWCLTWETWNFCRQNRQTTKKLPLSKYQ